MKKVFKHFFYSFIIIIGTSVMVAETIDIYIEPIVLAGAFLAYYKAAKELDEMIEEAHKHNSKTIEKLKSKEEQINEDFKY